MLVGGGLLPEYRRQQFKNEQHEFLVAISDEDLNTGNTVSGEFFADKAVLGAIDLTTGSREQGRTIMIWEPTSEEQQNGSFRELFREYGIYRVKGHPPIKPWYNVPDVRMGSLYLTEVIGEITSEPFLDKAIREYKDSLTLHSELLGVLELDDDGYKGSFNWVWTRISIVVSTEYVPYSRPLSYLEAFCRDCEQHDNELRSFACEKLKDNKRLAADMVPDSVCMYYDGDYDFYYKYKEYTVNISGDLNGPKELWIGKH